MDVFTMVVLIVFIACTTSLAGQYIKRRKRKLDGELEDQLRGEIDRMNERIAVLEQIVTDKKYRLSDEIAGLEREG